MAQIPLRRRDGTVRAYAIVDDVDFGWLNEWRWHLNGAGYVERCQQESGRVRHYQLHREITGVTDPAVKVDHYDNNPLDNRRSNLRVCTHAENMQNRKGPWVTSTSGYRGVSLVKRTGRWLAHATVAGKLYQLGYFDTPEQADECVRAFRATAMPFSKEAA